MLLAPFPAAELSLVAGEREALQELIGETDQRDVVNRLLSKISTLQAAAADAEATRRRLHNELVEVKGNVSVREVEGEGYRAE